MDIARGQDAERGGFEVILLHEQSRFSREDIFDVMLHWRLLREAGVDIVTCQGGRLRFDDLGGIITAIIDQHGAREESIKLAGRVVSGQRTRALQGKRIGGTVFGYDRQLYDDSGNPVQRISFRQKFRKPATWRSELVPSDERKLAALRQKIERGSENLALTEREDFAAITHLSMCVALIGIRPILV